MTPMNKKTLLFAILTVILAVGTLKTAKAQNNNQKYTGKIGQYEITMFVNFSMYDGDSIGYYYYNNRPNTKFKLVQTEMEAINAQGSMHVVMKEYTPKGTHSGTFDGQMECRGSGFEGEFTNSKGKKYKFELWEQYDF